MEELNKSVTKYVRDLSSKDAYERKHAVWMLTRIAEKRDAGAVVAGGAVPLLVDCLSDDDTAVRYRSIWALGTLAKKGERDAVIDAGALPILEKMVSSESDAEQDVPVYVCHPHTSEIIKTTISALVEGSLEELRE